MRRTSSACSRKSCNATFSSDRQLSTVNPLSWYWVMHGDELRPIGERRLDLHIGDHLGNAFHHVVAHENRCAVAHELGDRFAFARAFHDRGRNQRDRLGVIELQAARFAPLGEQRGGEDEELVFFAWGEVHWATGYGLRPEGRDYRGSANSGSPDSGHGGYDAEKWGTDRFPDAGERVAEWFGLHRERTVHEHVVDEGRARF